MATSNNVSFGSLVQQLVKVFKSSGLSQSYNSANVQYQLICGWCGQNSPISRPSYIERFGADTVQDAEREARRFIEQEKKAYLNSTYRMAEIEAASNEGRTPSPESLGVYAYAVTNWYKADCGVSGLILDMTESESLSTVIVRVDRVEKVEDSFFSDYKAADQLVKKIGAESFPGGGEEHQTPEGTKYITNVCACVSESGKYCFIDSEGYDYARYILFPTDWQTVLSDEYQAAAKKIADRKAAEQKAAEEAAAAREAAYIERMKKWAKYMEPVKKYEEAEKAAGYGTHEGKKATRKLQSVRRANILAMFKKACPGVKVSLVKYNGWGRSWELTYTDGPTLEELSKITDFSLFSTGRHVFDGYSDYWDFKEDEHTDFAVKYMGSWGTDGIEIYREMSDEKRTGIENEIISIIPELQGRERNDFGEHNFTFDELHAICDRFHVDYSKIAAHSERKGDLLCEWVSVIVRRVWNEITYQTEKEKEEKKAAAPVTVPDNTAAPADGLQIVEISDGVAVVGDSKVTYRNRKEIKAHGCTWNREAKQWEATTPETIESVKSWFGLSDVVNAAETVEEVQTVAAATVSAVKMEKIPRYSEPKKLEVSQDSGQNPPKVRNVIVSDNEENTLIYCLTLSLDVIKKWFTIAIGVAPVDVVEVSDDDLQFYCIDGRVWADTPDKEANVFKYIESGGKPQMMP